MALVIQTADQTSPFGDDSTRRRSTFYVPLSTEDLTSCEAENVKDCANDQMFNPNLSGYSCDWSLNDSIDSSEMLREKSQVSSDDSNRLKRYGIVLNGSVNIDDSNLEVHANHRRTKTTNITSSTPIKETAKICEMPSVMVASPVKEKSKTLPVKDAQAAPTFPPKNSFMLKSTPKISSSINYSSLSDTSALIQSERKAVTTPKKSLSFIRRTHSTKLSRNNSLLKSLTTKCVEHSNESLSLNVYDLSTERLALYLKADNCDELMRDLFFRESLDTSSSDSCGKNQKDNDDDALSGKNLFACSEVEVIVETAGGLASNEQCFDCCEQVRLTALFCIWEGVSVVIIAISCPQIIFCNELKINEFESSEQIHPKMLLFVKEINFVQKINTAC